MFVMIELGNLGHCFCGVRVLSVVMSVGSSITSLGFLEHNLALVLFVLANGSTVFSSLVSVELSINSSSFLGTFLLHRVDPVFLPWDLYLNLIQEEHAFLGLCNAILSAWNSTLITSHTL